MKYLSQKSEITKNKTRDKLHSSPRSHSNIWLEKFPATIAAVSQEIHICLHPCNSANQEDKKWVMFLYSLYVLQFVAKIKHSKWIENSSYVQQRCPSRIPSRLRAISGKKKPLPSNVWKNPSKPRPRNTFIFPHKAQPGSGGANTHSCLRQPGTQDVSSPYTHHTGH